MSENKNVDIIMSEEESKRKEDFHKMFNEAVSAGIADYVKGVFNVTTYNVLDRKAKKGKGNGYNIKY